MTAPAITADPRIAVLDTAITAEDAQKAQYRREKVARRKFYEERDRARREALCRTACALCPWEFNGTAEAGVRAAQAHRRADHPDRPVHSRQSRNRGAPTVGRPAKPETARRAANREAVLTAVKQLGAVWATTTEIAEAAGLTPQETGRLVRAEGYERARWRAGTRQHWLGPDEPPSRRRVCAAPGCDVEFAPNSGSHKFHSTACRDSTY